MKNKDFLLKLENMGAETEDAIQRLDGDEDLYIEFVTKLGENKDLEQLEEARKHLDNEEAMRIVHSIKGVSLSLGILPLADACIDALQEYREGNVTLAIQHLDTVEEVYRTWVDQIHEAL